MKDIFIIIATFVQVWNYFRIKGCKNIVKKIRNANLKKNSNDKSKTVIFKSRGSR